MCVSATYSDFLPQMSASRPLFHWSIGLLLLVLASLPVCRVFYAELSRTVCTDEDLPMPVHLERLIARCDTFLVGMVLSTSRALRIPVLQTRVWGSDGLVVSGCLISLSTGQLHPTSEVTILEPPRNGPPCVSAGDPVIAFLATPSNGQLLPILHGHGRYPGGLRRVSNAALLGQWLRLVADYHRIQQQSVSSVRQTAYVRWLLRCIASQVACDEGFMGTYDPAVFLSGVGNRIPVALSPQQLREAVRAMEDIPQLASDRFRTFVHQSVSRRLSTAKRGPLD